MLNDPITEIIEVNEDCYLRCIQMADSQAIFQLIEQYRDYFADYLDWVRFTQQPKDSENFIAQALMKIQQQKQRVFSIIYQQQCVGLISFNRFDLTDKSADIGYWLAPPYQHQGIVSLSLQALITRYRPEIQQFHLYCAVTNHASNQVAIRNGFTWLECLPKREKIGDRWVDDNHYVFG